MAKTKWSPGPWKFDSCLEDIVDANEQLVFEISIGLPGSSDDPARALANLHLIAAAPELYETLKLAEPYLRETTYWQQAASALAKARGES